MSSLEVARNPEIVGSDSLQIVSGEPRERSHEEIEISIVVVVEEPSGEGVQRRGNTRGDTHLDELPLGGDVITIEHVGALEL